MKPKSVRQKITENSNFLLQTTLVATGRTYLHRRMGIAGALLAALVVILGVVTAVARIKGGAAPIPGVPPLAFLAIPLFDMLVFGILVGAALWRRPADHSR